MPSAVGMGPTRGLACAHGRLRPDAKAVAVPADAWSRLRAEVSENGDDVCSQRKASVRESPPRTTFRTTTRVGFEPVTSATTMTAFASSRRSAGRSPRGGARARPRRGYPRASAPAPAAAFRARVSRVVLGGVRGMRGGARGDRRGEKRTARARRGARRERALRCFAPR